MSDTPIPSGGSYDLTTPLTSGTNIDFINTPVASGTLRIEPTAFENKTIVASGSTVVSTYLGGAINNFQAGDTIVIANLGSAYAEFDHAPSDVTASQNAAVVSGLSTLLLAEAGLGENEILTISADGSITDNTGLIEGQTLFIDGFIPVSIPATLISYLDTYATSIEQALFESATVTSDIFITLAADTLNPSLADAYITTDGTIVVCYLQGTNIRTESGDVAVENLQIGDKLVTRFGGVKPVKWIGRQSFAARFVKNNKEQIPVCIKAGALGDNLPLRDLFVSPGHSMLVGDTLVLAKHLINGITITQDYVPDEIHYYQIEFEQHDCVLAEGCWSESYADCPGLRNKFHNAASFHALYPDYRTPEQLQLCAPRPQSGAAFAAALWPAVAQASQAIQPGHLRGAIDKIAPHVIKGWAQDMANPQLPVLLEVLLEDVVIGTALACAYRGDLAEAGIGNGRCGFTFKSPMTIDDAAMGQISIRRAADGTEIFMTKTCWDNVGVSLLRVAG
jgi:hypothetical protein